LGAIYHALARQKECQILEGHVMPDHDHMCITIPLKYPVASVIGFLKGKSAIAVAPELCGRERISQENIFGQGDMRYPPLGLSWSRSANTSAAKRKRMDQVNSSDAG
jgi:putative transposase